MQIKQGIKQNSKIPLVSFIITYYNLPLDMLKECIESILALSLRPYEREIIIVDDGSDISPMNDIIGYGNDIIYIRKRNEGVSTARNTGMDVAKGKYIQFVDGDDLLVQAYYEHCLDTVRYNDFDMVMFGFTRTKDNSFTLPVTTQALSGTEYMHNHNINGAAWSYLFKSAMAGKLRFAQGINYGEDEHFTPQLLLRAESVVYTDAKAYYYRQRKDSALHQTSIRRKVRRIDDNLNVILHLQEISRTLPQADNIAMQRRIAQLTMDYIYNTIILTRSAAFVNNKLKELYDKGLFPLPDKNYTKKYKWFRRMTNSKVGLAILIKTLPLLKKEE